jgi:RND superfamily putative drug exporter
VLFPMLYFLRSFAYAGIALVVLAAGAAIVITPAVIVLLGPRLDALDVRNLVRRRGGQRGTHCGSAARLPVSWCQVGLSR